MREKLKELGSDRRYTFIAKIKLFSFKKGFINRLPLKTVLLVKVMCEGKQVANHVWLTCGRRIYALLPQVGQWLKFDARVTKYLKGYNKNKEDYRLSYPTKISIIKKKGNKHTWKI